MNAGDYVEVLYELSEIDDTLGKIEDRLSFLSGNIKEREKIFRTLYELRELLNKEYDRIA